jgi:hypothetical protein
MQHLASDLSTQFAQPVSNMGLCVMRRGSIVELLMPRRFTRRQLAMVGTSALGASATAATTILDDSEQYLRAREAEAM